MTDTVYLDHLAIGVAHWNDGFPRLVGEYGGAWSHGGDAGEFMACQLIYEHGMRLELISPGEKRTDGFMARFIQRGGPGPHHLTFKVPSLDGMLDEVMKLGIEPLGGRTNLPMWKEAFLHPNQAGVGTLLQLAEVDDEALAKSLSNSVPPQGYLEQPVATTATIAWIGLTVENLSAAEDLFIGALQGGISARGDGWILASWGPSRSLLFRDAGATPGGAALWPEPGLGVGHVMLGAATLVPADLEKSSAAAVPAPGDPLTGVPFWSAAEALTAL